MTQRGRPLSPAECEFFEAFFRQLSAAGVAAILLRNYADFPEAIGHDLDVFFRLAGARPFKQFQAPRPAHEALNLFLTSLLWGSFFKARYGETIRVLLEPPGEREEFDRI